MSRLLFSFRVSTRERRRWVWVAARATLPLEETVVGYETGQGPSRRRLARSARRRAARDPRGSAERGGVLEQDAPHFLDGEGMALHGVSGERDHELGFRVVDARVRVRDDTVGGVRAARGAAHGDDRVRRDAGGDGGGG